MYWKSSLLALLLLLGSCREKEAAPVVVDAPAAREEGYFNPQALVDAADLMQLSGEEHIKVVDFRKREDFDQGHIPGALPLWRTDIEDREAAVQGLIASRETMEALLSELGISSEDTIVIYDDRGCVDAARLWWVLQVYGYDKTRLLNGGLHAWESQNGPLNSRYIPPPHSAFRFEGPGRPSMKIGRDSVLALLGNPEWILIDTRTSDEYSGKRLKEGALAAGRIPGSINIDWAEAVHFNGDMTFRPVEQLRKKYGRIPDDPGQSVIAYCHSGVRSAHTSFVLTQLLGYNQVHNYDGSWLEWSSFEGAPIEKDSITSILK
ncbi:MAG: sulfurtransferase [Flavobacteriaceae bacterium]|jgi:thiosulfate/3-mercaptopyruvate sulfurtransferase|nr:MAG: sulfurtransferase [Flavobacteriaceae bacterium]